MSPSLPRLLTAALAAALAAAPALAAPPAKPAAQPAPAAAPAAAKPPPKPIELSPAETAARREKMAAQVTGVPSFAWPANRAALDGALAKGDAASLVALFKAPTTIEELMLLANWQRYQVWTGGDYNMAFVYAVSLWRAGESYEKAATGGEAKAAPIAAALKRSAAFALLYAVTISQVDGVRCADRTAPQSHTNDIVAHGKAVLEYARTLPLEERRQVVSGALQLEQATAPLREARPALCRGGTADMAAADVSKAKPVANAPGTVGKTYEVPLGPPKGPIFTDRKLWPQHQAVARQAIVKPLLGLIGLAVKTPEGAPAAPPAKKP